MNLKRIWTLIKTETFHGPKDFVLVMAVAIPVLLALFVNLAFGEIFSDRAKLGIFDDGKSQIVSRLRTVDNLDIEIFSTEADLRAAAASGAVDMGIVLPADFDARLAADTVRLKAYIWGESLAKNRAVIPFALANTVRDMTGAELPVTIDTVALGDESSLPWSDRLLPLTVLLAIFFGGMMLPASSLIHEKQRGTLQALNVTPTTIEDIFVAKGILGAVLANIMGVIALAIGTSFGASPLALVLVLALGASMAAEIGLILGAFIKDLNTLFAFWKFGGLLLFGPAIVFMFPQIPKWVGYIFPTFYFIKPVTDMTVFGQDFGQVALYVEILTGIVVVMAVAVMNIIKRLGTRALTLNG